MTYKCPNCGHTSDQPGNCPSCNVPMEEVKEGVSEGMPSASDTSQMPSEDTAPEGQ